MMQETPVGARIFVIGSFVAACTVTVDVLPAAGESRVASAFAMEPGGKGFNLAVACRRLGASVDGVMAVGDDSLGAIAAPAFARAGLASGMLVTRPGSTGAGVGFIAADGENCLALHPGANLALSAADVLARADAVRAADMTLAQFEIGDAPVLAGFAIARAAGRRTFLNPSPFRTPPPGLLAATSILCVNAVEARALATALGVMDGALEVLAEAVFATGSDALVVTRGREGAVAFRRGVSGVLVQPAFAVEAIDTLGAGDAFAAGLATALAEGRGWPNAMRRAAACGALAASAFGVFDALPGRAEAESLMDRYDTPQSSLGVRCSPHPTR